MRACMHACIHTCIHTYIQTCMHAYLHTNIHTYIQTCIHTYIHMHVIVTIQHPPRDRNTSPGWCRLQKGNYSAGQRKNIPIACIRSLHSFSPDSQAIGLLTSSIGWVGYMRFGDRLLQFGNDGGSDFFLRFWPHSPCGARAIRNSSRQPLLFLANLPIMTGVLPKFSDPLRFCVPNRPESTSTNSLLKWASSA